MNLAEIKLLVGDKWWTDFVRFVQEGEATEEFLAHVDADERTQKAVELALESQTAALREVAEALRGPVKPLPDVVVEDAEAILPGQIAAAFSAFAKLPERQRQEVGARVVDVLRSEASRSQISLGALKDFTEKLSAV
jgi:hypothetical protein